MLLYYSLSSPRVNQVWLDPAPKLSPRQGLFLGSSRWGLILFLGFILFSVHTLLKDMYSSSTFISSLIWSSGIDGETLSQHS